MPFKLHPKNDNWSEKFNEWKQTHDQGNAFGWEYEGGNKAPWTAIPTLHGVRLNDFSATGATQKEARNKVAKLLSDNDQLWN